MYCTWKWLEMFVVCLNQRKAEGGAGLPTFILMAVVK